MLPEQLNQVGDDKPGTLQKHAIYYLELKEIVNCYIHRIIFKIDTNISTKVNSVKTTLTLCEGLKNNPIFFFSSLPERTGISLQ